MQGSGWNIYQLFVEALRFFFFLKFQGSRLYVVHPRTCIVIPRRFTHGGSRGNSAVENCEVVGIAIAFRTRGLDPRGWRLKPSGSPSLERIPGAAQTPFESPAPLTFAASCLMCSIRHRITGRTLSERYGFCSLCILSLFRWFC